MVVEKIFISPIRGATQIECERIMVQAEAGIVGDRNFGLAAYPGQNLTLVEAEEIEAFCERYQRSADLSQTRRNVLTRGVRLNDLLHQEFRIGSVLVRGVALCEPCSLLGGLLSDDSLPLAAAIKYWVGRGGLSVDVIASGEICVGDAVGVII